MPATIPCSSSATAMRWRSRRMKRSTSIAGTVSGKNFTSRRRSASTTGPPSHASETMSFALA